jgi:hypothetical protein
MKPEPTTPWQPRWKRFDVVLGDNLIKPWRLIVEVNDKTRSYTVCSESGGVGYQSDHSLRTKEEWLTWVDRFSDDLTGRELREAKEYVRAPFIQPQCWIDFRKRFELTGDPWLKY